MKEGRRDVWQAWHGDATFPRAKLANVLPHEQTNQPTPIILLTGSFSTCFLQRLHVLFAAPPHQLLEQCWYWKMCSDFCFARRNSLVMRFEMIGLELRWFYSVFNAFVPARFFPEIEEVNR